MSLVLMLALAVPAFAQSVTGTISGTVTDTTGAAIVGAKVTATDVDRQTKMSTTTDSSGLFSLVQVPIGRYQVTAEKDGFKIAKYPVFTLILNQVAQLNIPLTPGTQTVIEVTGTTPLLETGSEEVSTLIDSHTTETIPLATRNYSQLTLLSPGAVNPNPQSFSGPQSTFQSGRPFINGNREQVNYYALDGMENTEHDNNDVGYSPNVDAIQEFNLITSNAPADFGNYLGGIVNTSIKSGTNQFHGDVFEFIRNDVFNANEWSNNLLGKDAAGHEIVPRTTLRWNEFGGTIGGPIVKDKLFFFADYQGSRFDQPAITNSQTVLTAAERGGDFSSIATQIYVPTPTTLPSARAACAGNNLTGCGLTLDAAALKIVNSPYYPLPTSGQKFLYRTHSNNNGDQGDLKVDYHPTQSDSLFVRYSELSQVNPTTNTFALLPNQNNNFPLYNGVIDWTRTVTPSLVNDLRLGVSYFPIDQGFTNQTGVNLPQTFGIQSPSSFLPAIDNGTSGISGAGTFSQIGGFGNNLSAANGFHDTEYQLNDGVTWTKGKHEIHTGVQWNNYRDNFFYPGNEGTAGFLNFGGFYTGNGGSSSGVGEADFMLGLPDVVGIGANAGFRHVDNSIYALFVQDNYRMSSHLTVNAGLRWEYSSPRSFVDNQGTNWNILTGVPSFAGVNGASQSLYNGYTGIANFQPRLGLAWQPEMLKNTVVRAAWSMSNFNETNGVNNLPSQNPPWQTSHSIDYATTAADLNYPGSTLDQGFSTLGSANCTMAGVTTYSSDCYKSIALHAFDPNYRPEVSEQWNLSVQHQFGNSTTLQAGYVGQHAYELSNIVLLEQNVLSGGVVTPSPFLLGPTGPILSQVGAARFSLSNGVSNYEALQVVLQQRLAKGLQAQVNYTFSKCLTDTPGFFGQFGDSFGASQTDSGWAFPQNTYNQRGDYGRCNFDAPHLLNGYVIYDMPFGRGRLFGNNMNKVLDGVVGGWTVDTDFTFHSGYAWTLANAADSSGTGSGQPRPNCNAGVSQTLPFQMASAAVQAQAGGPAFQYLNPASVSFVPGSSGVFGDCPVGSHRGLPLKTADLGLAKHFAITERTNIEFRAEAINVTNTPQFIAPGYWGGMQVTSGVNTGPTGFGVVNGSVGARELQFAMKVHF